MTEAIESSSATAVDYGRSWLFRLPAGVGVVVPGRRGARRIRRFIRR